MKLSTKIVESNGQQFALIAVPITPKAERDRKTKSKKSPKVYLNQPSDGQSPDYYETTIDGVEVMVKVLGDAKWGPKGGKGKTSQTQTPDPEELLASAGKSGGENDIPDPFDQ